MKMQNIMAGKRDIRLDNLRGLLITIVVIGHFLLPLYRTRFVTGLLYAIYIFHMPCFIMLSGYFAKGAYRRENAGSGSPWSENSGPDDRRPRGAGADPADTDGKGRFLWGRAVQLFWLYLLYELVVWITEGLAAGSIPRVPDLLHESGAPWYLMSLGCYYLCIPLLEKARGLTLTKRSPHLEKSRPAGEKSNRHAGSKRYYSALFIAAVMLAVSFLKYVIQPGDFLSLDRTIAFLPFFCLGYLTEKQDLQNFFHRGKKTPGSGLGTSAGSRIVSAAALVLLLIVFLFTYDYLMRWHLVVYGADYRRYLPEMQPRLWILNMIWYGLAAVISLGVAGLMPERPLGAAGPSFNLSLDELGRRSLQIYFLHRPIRDILEWRGFYAWINPHSKVQVIALAAGSIVLTILLGMPWLTGPFEKLRHWFDPLLEKSGGL